MINIISCPLAHISGGLSSLAFMYRCDTNSPSPFTADGEFYIPDDYFEKNDANYLKKEYCEVKPKFDEWIKPIKEYLKKHPMTEI